MQDKYVFSYEVTIENQNPYSVQLLSRHWMIMDSHLVIREVRGLGVIGKQPILPPNGKYSYSSWSAINTSMGKMTGSYQMIRTADNEKFDVRIPVFLLTYSALLN